MIGKKFIIIQVDLIGMWVEVLILLETEVYFLLWITSPKSSCQESHVIRICLYCLSATCSFWVRKNKFYLWAELPYVLFYGSSITFFGAPELIVLTRLHDRSVLRHSYYIELYLFFSSASALYLRIYDSVEQEERSSKIVIRMNSCRLFAQNGTIPWNLKQRISGKVRWLLQMTLGFSVIVV